MKINVLSRTSGLVAVAALALAFASFSALGTAEAAKGVRTEQSFALADGASRTDTVASSGTVTIKRVGATLDITNVTTTAGNSSTIQVDNTREVEVNFRGTGGRVAYNAELEGGQVRIRVTTAR